MKRIILLLAIMVTSISATPISGTISSDTTWSDSVQVDDDLTIAYGATVTIKPGTVINVTSAEITVKGAVKALATVSDTIRFIGSWDGFTYETSVSDSSLFEYCLFTGASKSAGGGAFNITDINIIRFSHCKFYKNSAYSKGGALYIYTASVIVENCEITNNRTYCSSTNNSNSYGGGIYYVASTINLKNCIISENTAYSPAASASNSSYGAGIYAVNSPGTIENCEIIENTADASQNASAYGGGIYLSSSSPTIKNCKINGNTLTSWKSNSGSAIYMQKSSPIITSCEITGNSASASAQYSAGGAITGAFTTTAVISFDTKIYDNVPSNGAYGSYVIVDKDTTFSGDIFLYGFTIAENVTVTIEKGSNITMYPGSEIIVYGAFVAKGTEEDSITFNPPTSETTTYSWGGFTINGGETNDSTIFEYCSINSATKKAAGGLFYISSTDKIRISHCDIMNGKAYQAGGGIYLTNSTLSLQNTTISKCKASSEAFDFRNIYGAGVYAINSTLKMGNCDLRENTMSLSDKDGYGAGIYTVNTDLIVTGPNAVHFNQPRNSNLYRSISFEKDTTIGGEFIHNGFTIPQGVTVTFLPGTVIKGYGDAHISVGGNIIAEGTANDSIIFTNIDSTETWGGIRFWNNTADSTTVAEFSYVIIENAAQASRTEYGYPYGALEVVNHYFNISNSTIRNCTSPKNQGGGIRFNSSVSHIVDNCVFKNNYAVFGSAIYSVGSDLSITNSEFIENSNLSGGTVYQKGGTITVDSSSFTRNEGKVGFYLYCENTTFNCSNIPERPMYASYSTTSVAKSLVYVKNSSGTIENSALIGVDSTYVYGLYILASTIDVDTLTDYSLEVKNSLINKMYVYTSNPIAYDVDIDNSTILYSSKIYDKLRTDESPTISFDIENSIFNYTSALEEDSTIAFNARYSNLFGFTNFSVPEGLSNISEDPLFVDPENNDYHLQLLSPSVNSGASRVYFDDDATDLDGYPRIYGGRIDMGAFEQQGASAVEDEYTSFSKTVIYPNPVQSILHIDPSLEGKMFIYNENGKKIVSNFSGSIAVHILPKGTYTFVLIDTNNKKFFQKFYKE